MKHGEEYRHLLIAQRALNAAIEDKETEAKDLSSLTRALVAVLDQKRIMRMKPKPRDVDTTKLPQRRRAAQPATNGSAPSFSEPTPPPTLTPQDGGDSKGVDAEPVKAIPTLEEQGISFIADP